MTDMRRSAVISKCQKFRYSLSRVWDEAAPRCMFVGLNPSTADHRQDDPTIRKCIKFAEGFQFGGFEMLNIFAYRSSKPERLLDAKDPVGPLNTLAILSAAKACATCIVAWGLLTTRARQRALDYDRRTLAMLRLIMSSGYHPQVYCLGMTKQGYPRHPLFVRGDTPLQIYENPRLDKYNAAIAKRKRLEQQA